MSEVAQLSSKPKTKPELEAKADYKDYLNAMIKDAHYNPRPMVDLMNFYNKLKQAK